MISSKTTDQCKSETQLPMALDKLEVVPSVLSVDDDRYPGSFFRIPGIATPGKTTWSVSP